MMEDYCINLELLSPSGTPWHSDTIFGHLCWQVVFGALDIGIDDFLSPFREGKPPFVLSDGFPAGYLPRPLLPYNPMVVDNIEQYEAVKKGLKAPYITVEDFLVACRGKKPTGKPLESPWEPHLTPHASLDRNRSNTGEESGFFETESEVLKHETGLEIYLRTELEWKEKVVSLLENCSKSGYGRDKSIGLGAFRLKDIARVDIFQPFGDANGFVSLSSMVPSENDPIEARFRTRTKFGKLGEGIYLNPFKRPLIQMEPGAAFLTDGKLKPYYGRLVEDIAPGNERVVQNCYALAVPCRYAEIK